VLVPVEELDRRGADVLHIRLHAAAGVEEEAEAQRRRERRVARGEEPDALRAAAFHDFEVGLGQPGDRRPLLVRDGDGEVHQIHAGAEGLRLHCRAQRRGEQHGQPGAHHEDPL
jgi:hypothetical protein